jgi:hypothetical protein
MNRFKKNECYTRKEIHALLGGSIVSYLPTVNRTVVAGCFRLDTNPDAPDIILPGNGQLIKKTAEFFASSGVIVPVFIKRNIEKWCYVGNFRVSKQRADKDEIKGYAQRTGRTDISSILFLEEV